MIVHEQHPVFGRLPVVEDRKSITKTDLVILRTTLADDITVDQLAGPSSQSHEIVAAITKAGDVVYLVVRDETYRLSYRLYQPDGVPDTLSGLYTTPQRAVEAALATLP